jgi:O-acetyl-ADP-ribose deacetylase (regulator of RNase III)
MIVFKTGDIFTEDVEALVNPVNCIGIMGRGVALQFKKAWPENYKVYVEACRKHEVQPGRMFVFENSRNAYPVDSGDHWSVLVRRDTDGRPESSAMI